MGIILNGLSGRDGRRCSVNTLRLIPGDVLVDNSQVMVRDQVFVLLYHDCFSPQ